MVVDDAPSEPPGRTAGKRPRRIPVAPARFTGTLSPFASAGLGNWRPVEDRRPRTPRLVPVPRYGGPTR